VQVQRRRADVVALLLGVTVLLLVVPVAGSGDVGPREERLFRLVNDLPDALFWPLWSAQTVGVMGMPLLVSAVAAAHRRWRLTAALVLLVPLKLVVEREVLKALVARSRPSALLEEVAARDVPVAGLAFPSGHAIIAFGIVALVVPYLSWHWRLFVLVLAVLNGVSRVYLGAHAPLDIVAGAAAGVALGSALNLVLGRPLATGRDSHPWGPPDQS
jgi:membrane-associated phospholipid phosphatase